MAAMNLPPEVMYNVLEHVDSLNDLGSLSLTNKWMADLVRNIRGKTLWRIAYRTCHRRGCDLHQEEQDEVSPCNCSVVAPALQEPGSAPWKVRAWLYARACRRSFGADAGFSALELCQVDLQEPFNPYDSDTLGVWINVESDTDSEYERRVLEWNTTWMTFTRYLTMQRVQQVSTEMRQYCLSGYAGPT